MSFLQRISHRSRLISADPSCLNRPRIRRRFLLIVFLSGLITAFSAQAVLPAVIMSLGRMAVTDLGTTLVVGVIAKGFAANDPYVSTDVRITKAQLSKNLAQKGKGFWTALAMGAVAIGGDYLIDKVNDELLKRTPSAPQVAASQCILYASSIYPDCVGQKMPAEKITKKDSPDGCYISNKYYSVCEEISLDYGHYEWSQPGYLGWIRYVAYGPKEPDQFFPATPDDIRRDILPLLSTAPNFNELFAKADLNQLLDGGEMTYRPAAKNASFAELMDAYNRGLLQTTDSSAPFFVTPDLFNEVKQAAESEKALNTDEGQLDALNSKMKQPITQAQYEESNAKADLATQQALVPVSGLDTLMAPFEQYQSDVTQTPNQSINSLPMFGFPRFGGGSCSVISLNFSIMGESFESDTSALCGFYYEYLLPAFTALFYILTGFVIWLDVREAISRRV